LIENFFCKLKEFKRIAVRGAKVRARSSLLNSGWDGELASDSSDSISHSQHHPLCECVPGLLPLLRIAMRADKTDHRFEAIIHLAAAVINSR
jgi:hypothetical protein